MKHISLIASLLKKNQRLYTLALLSELEDRGYTDLRPSFIEIMSFLAENEGASIKEIGQSCGLKKQTMTTHINELEKRGYINRQIGSKDRREQKIYLTHYGQSFKLILQEVVELIDRDLSQKLGGVEIERLYHVLDKLHSELKVKAKS